MFNIQKIKTAYGFFAEVFGKQRAKIITLTWLGFVSGLLGGVGIGAIIPLFSLVINKEVGTDFISKTIAFVFSAVGLPFNIYILLTFIGLLFILKAIFLYIANYINYRLAYSYMKETQSELTKYTFDASWGHLSEQKLGFLSTLLTADIDAAKTALTNLSGIILTTTSLLMYGVVAINISLETTLFTFCMGILLFFIQKPLLYRTRKLAQLSSMRTKAMAHFINEHILGAKTVKSMAVEKPVIEKSIDYFEMVKNTQLEQYKYSIIFSTFMEPVTLLFITAVFIISYHRPGFNVITLIATLYLIQKMFSFFQSIQGKINGINDLTPYMHNVLDYQHSANQFKEVDSGVEPFALSQELAFEHISFSYRENDLILKDINFSMKAGQTIGIVGPSGVGKTTIVDLLLRLWEPASGHILIDGKDVKNIKLKNWRQKVGYVSQDIFLLNDTIENNIKFYADISTEQIVEAAKQAQIYDFIMESPEKFKTVVGERGIKLSGGQRQRIVLARILARQPKLLILDEATSALDNESESKIQQAIKDLHGKITILIIAHRLSTVMHGDKILVLNNGTVVEEGSPQELLKNQESYFYKNYNINN